MRSGLMKQLGPAAVDWRKQMHRRRFQRREVIFHQGEIGDTIHLIEKGCVLVEAYIACGDMAGLSVRWPGDIVGELAVVGNGRRSARVTALEPTETLALTRQTLTELRSAEPAVDRYFLNVVADKLAQSTEQLVDVLFAPVETRVMRALLRLVAAFDRGVHPVVVKVRQSDIAAMSGSSRQSANHALKLAESGGVIRTGRGRIEVLDLSGLRALAR
ncbi:MAG: Crp/Fnr family transcriptional regulator [Acidimicrobiaceae bacterium]|nr:Crp/Fnr family transcriptional regulator [Acidimicrobiaceae bacterium]